MAERSGSDFINIKYPSLQKSPEVESAIKIAEMDGNVIDKNSKKGRLQALLGEELHGGSEEDNPDLSLYGKIFNNPDKKDRDRRVEKYKEELLYPEVLIDKDNVPDSYFQLQIKIAREEGKGGDLRDVKEAKDIPKETRRKTGELLYKDQKGSLDNWIDYLADPDTKYPTWFNYYALKSVLKLGAYDKENHAFKNRLKDTVAPFPELNRAALAKVNDILINKYGTEYFQLREEIGSTKSKLEKIDDYERRLTIAETGKDKDGKGLHIKKKDLEKMKQSLLSNPVSETNKDELKEKLTDLVDKQNQYLQLRNIPDKFTGIPEEEDFGKIYAYAIHEMTPASKENKEKTEGEWSKFNQGDDPTALFESLQGHGLEWCTAGGMETARTQLEGGDFYVYYSKDEKGLSTIPRIAIRMENDQVAEVRGIEKDQNLEGNMTDIAKEKYHQLPGGEKFDKKDHDMKLLTLIDNKNNNNQQLTKEEIKFLYEVDNKIEGFGYQKDPRIEEMISKRNIKLDLAFVYDCEPEQISNTEEEALSGNIKFHYGSLNLVSLTSAEGLTLPDTINGNLYLNNLTSAEGLKLPNTIGGDLNLVSLTSAEGLTLPDTINGTLYLDSLTSAEGLTLPDTIGWSLSLSRLTSAKGLTLPDIIYGSLYLSSLTSAEGLVFPNIIGGDLDLSSLTSAEGLKLPKSIGGSLDLSSLTSAEGLKLPNSIGGGLRLYRLTSAKGLKFPDNVDGYVALNSLTSDERHLISKQYPKLQIAA